VNKIVEYRLVYGLCDDCEDINIFTKNVNALIDEGFQPVEGAKVTGRNRDEIIQTMVKYEKSN